MRIQSIALTNFRQFAGTQEFDLRTEPDHPVTVIFGANGAGKTTLLNAFSWALYGSMSSDVEQQERMVTDIVWRDLPLGGTTDVAVEVCFEHEGKDYRLVRRETLRKESDQQPRIKPDPELWVTLPDGSSEALQAPQAVILNILPGSVSRFFFFNGERIENLVKKGAYAEVQQDIKVLLDLEPVERALTHLPKVERKLGAELRKHGGAKASQIQEAIDELNERQSERREELTILEGEVASLAEERDEVEELLRQHAESRPIQERRDAVTRDLNAAREALQKAEDERRLLIAREGFLAFTRGLSQKTSEMAESLYQKGALPAPLKREFVDQLLEEAVCICGTPLSEDSDQRSNVIEWRQKAGLQAVESAWQKLQGQMEGLASARDALQAQLAGLMKRIGDERDRVDGLVVEKSELDDKLRNSRLEDVQQLESKRLRLDDDIRAGERSIGGIKKDLERISADIEQRNRERSKAEVTDELAQKARTRAELVTGVKRALEEIRAIREAEMRRRLDEKLKAVFRRIIKKNVTPTLSDKFELTLHQDLGGGVILPMPKSTGENQVLSVSFVAAVSELAREIRTEKRAEGDSAPDAGTYPIVMDAAFGSLDDNYQEAVSDVLAKMAPQLVVLVSKSQGLGRVLPQLKPHVSHIGVIETHTSAAGNVEETIEISGHEYPYIVADTSDYAELKVIQ